LIVASSESVIAEIARAVEVRPEPASSTPMRLESKAFHGFRRSFDSKLGGFGGAPKFPARRLRLPPPLPRLRAQPEASK
jgi:uncharacterized protein YyaL (SSP411 family)